MTSHNWRRIVVPGQGPMACLGILCMVRQKRCKTTAGQITRVDSSKFGQDARAGRHHCAFPSAHALTFLTLRLHVWPCPCRSEFRDAHNCRPLIRTAADGRRTRGSQTHLGRLERVSSNTMLLIVCCTHSLQRRITVDETTDVSETRVRVVPSSACVGPLVEDGLDGTDLGQARSRTKLTRHPFIQHESEPTQHPF